jgi:hypothetical protein
VWTPSRPRDASRYANLCESAGRAGSTEQCRGVIWSEAGSRDSPVDRPGQVPVSLGVGITSGDSRCHDNLLLRLLGAELGGGTGGIDRLDRAGEQAPGCRVDSERRDGRGVEPEGFSKQSL